jgi:hypothetical protein
MRGRQDVLSDHKRQEFGILALSSHVVSIAVESEKPGHANSTHAVEQAEFPPDGSRRKAQRPKCVANIMLTIPECALSILPGLAPENGRQPDKE